MARVKAGLLLVVFLSLSGCSFFYQDYEARISGRVVNATAGEAVRGSRVWVHGLNSGFQTSVLADAGGYFSVAVPADRYELKATRNGYATSHVIGLRALDGLATLQIVQRPLFNPRWSKRPPEITLTGVSDGARLNGQVSYRVDTEADHDIDLIYVAIGKTPGASFTTGRRHAFSETPTTGEQQIDPADYGARGPTTFEVVVYDMNGNRTHLIRYVTVEPERGAVLPPSAVKPIAVTLGKQILFYGGGPGPEAAVDDTNLYVELSWEPSPTDGLSGYRVGRSLDGESFAPIATVGPEETTFTDAGAGLRPGQTVYYRVAALRGGDVSAWSEEAQTTPLQAFDVRLLGPSDDEEGVSRQPVFRWQPTRRVGNHQLYGAILWDTVLGEQGFWITPDPPEFGSDVLSWRWNQDGRYDGTPWARLQPERVYEWEVAYALAVDDLEDPSAVSVAANRLGIAHPSIPIVPIGIEATHNFTFTTGN